MPEKFTMIRGNTETLGVSILDADGHEVTLSGDDKVLFLVRYPECVTPSEGVDAVVIRRVLTAEDYDASGNLVFTLETTDTKDLEPITYQFGLTYMPSNGGEAYTFDSGSFVLLPDSGTTDDLTGE